MTTFHYQRKIKSYGSKGTSLSLKSLFGKSFVEGERRGRFFEAISDH
jgi:hypothetical protein